MPGRSVDGGGVDASGVAASVGDDELSGIGIGIGTVSDGVGGVGAEVDEESVTPPDAQAVSAAVATIVRTSARVRRAPLTDSRPGSAQTP